MRLSLPAAGLLALGLSLSPAMLLAQGVVATELWQSWQEGVAEAGGTLRAAESREGNKLVLRDLQLEFGEAGGLAQVEVITLTNQADGSVAVVLPETFPLVIESSRARNGQAPGEKAVMMVSAPALGLIVRGIHERAEFEAAAPRLEIRFDRFIPARPDMGEGQFGLSFDNPVLRWQSDAQHQLPRVEGALSFDRLEALIVGPGGKERDLTLALTLAQGETLLRGIFPRSPAEPADGVPENGAPENGAPANGASENAAPENAGAGEAPAALPAGPEGDAAILRKILQVLADGFDLDASAKFAGLDLQVSRAAGPGETGEILGLRLASGAFSLGADAAKAGVGLEASGLALEGPGALFGLATADAVAGLDLGELRLAAELGLNGLRGPQDWRFDFTLGGLDFAQSLWQQFDPAGALPRDALKADLGLSGSYTVSEAALQASDLRGFGQSLSGLSFALNKLDLAWLGAGLSGTGGLRLDMTDLTSWEGYPAPEGGLSFAATGVYGAADQLHETGLLSEEDLFALRAGLMMIAKSAAGEDSLTSEIAFREGGLILNGVKLR